MPNNNKKIKLNEESLNKVAGGDFHDGYDFDYLRSRQYGTYIENVHPSAGNYRCPKCKNTFKADIRSFGMEDTPKCKICNQVSKRSEFEFLGEDKKDEGFSLDPHNDL